MTEVKKQPNGGKELEIKVGKDIFLRYPVKTHLISIKEDITPIYEEIKKEYQKGDFIAISEKFLTISEGRVMHKSLLKPGILAKIIYRLIRFNMGEKAYKNDPAFAIPEKIQAAIFVTGWWRMFLATIIGLPLTAILKIFGIKKGYFYKIAGNNIEQIDGPYYGAMPPFDEFAKIYPDNPDLSCQKIEDEFGVPACIADANNINVEILGKSKNLPVSEEVARKTLLDNPMGQGNEKTPIILIRKK
ncbi:hypothetical protein CSB11_01190 [Candidatus Campbellbacteria bacterium]|nr:MAG: hypothetical protein CSB11_01190 [Candidatus Campbellbacteria bacterium]